MNSPTRASSLERYLKQDPDNTSLRSELADALIDVGQWDKARAVVEEGLQRSPNEPQFLYRSAVLDHRTGQLDAARSTLTALLTSGIDAPELRLELARVQTAQSDHQACADTLAPLAHQALPSDIAAEITFLRVRALHHLGDLSPAIQAAEQLLQLQPDSPALQSALATLYLDAGRSEDTARLYRQAAQQRSLDAEMLAAGGFVELGDGEVELALTRFQQSLSQAPKLGRSLLGAGLAHAAAGRLDEAKKALTEATRSMPTHLGSWHALAWMHLLDKELDAAEAAFNQALAVDRNFGDTYGGPALVAAMRGDRARAEELVRTGGRLDRASMNVGLAAALLQQGGSMHSAEFLQRGLELLQANAMAGNPSMQAAFASLLKSRLGKNAR